MAQEFFRALLEMHIGDMDISEDDLDNMVAELMEDDTLWDYLNTSAQEVIKSYLQ